MIEVCLISDHWVIFSVWWTIMEGGALNLFHWVAQPFHHLVSLNNGWRSDFLFCEVNYCLTVISALPEWIFLFESNRLEPGWSLTYMITESFNNIHESENKDDCIEGTCCPSPYFYVVCENRKWHIKQS